MGVTVALTLNGDSVSAEVEPRTLLVQLIRDHFRLTGTHVGCDTSQCGACVVHVNGQSVKSCTILAAQAEGADVKTIESLADKGQLHPMQQAFKDNHGLQCGFCTPGMLTTAEAFLKENPSPGRSEVESAISGNICRCTGYISIVDAILDAATRRAEKGDK